MLLNRRDMQSLLYMLAQPLLVMWQWLYGFNVLAYMLVLFLTLGIGVIHHNHTHRRMWSNKSLNRLTDLWLSVLQGHPTFVFYAAHIANHHRYRGGEKDLTRTTRYGGDHNHLWGYLIHPIHAVITLYPVFWRWLVQLRIRNNGAWRWCMQQYVLVLLVWLVLASIDWRLWLIYVLIPQLHGLHWLLATNYLQHAHTIGGDPLNHARNFEGWVNPLLFNIGLHTAHHAHPRAHWSELTVLHTRYRDRVASQLNVGPLIPYMLRTFIGGLFVRRWRSKSLASAYKD